MTRIAFVDTETTGLSLDDDIWEFAAIIREDDGTEHGHQFFIEHDPGLCAALRGPFLSDHMARFPSGHAVAQSPDVLSRQSAALTIAGLLGDKIHIVGAVPNFDTERIALLLRRFGIEPGWHYHLIDVENFAVGWLAGLRAAGGGENGKDADLPSLPWDSDDLSYAVNVDPDDYDRHTALGDAMWARDIYDAVTSSDR